MNSPSLLEKLKEHALSLGYTLVAEDFDGGTDFLAPDSFVVRDAAGATYSISIDRLTRSGG